MNEEVMEGKSIQEREGDEGRKSEGRKREGKRQRRECAAEDIFIEERHGKSKCFTVHCFV